MDISPNKLQSDFRSVHLISLRTEKYDRYWIREILKKSNMDIFSIYI